MKDSLRRKLEELVERHEDLAHSLSDPEVINDQAKFRRMSQEYAQLEALTEDYRAWRALVDEIADLEDMESADETELREDGLRIFDTTTTHLHAHHALREDPVVEAPHVPHGLGFGMQAVENLTAQETLARNASDLAGAMEWKDGDQDLQAEFFVVTPEEPEIHTGCA